jgi:heme exporter protein D
MGGLDLDMGRYAAFVWPCYGLSLLVVGWLVWSTLSAARRWKAAAEDDEEPAG